MLRLSGRRRLRHIWVPHHITQITKLPALNSICFRDGRLLSIGGTVISVINRRGVNPLSLLQQVLVSNFEADIFGIGAIVGAGLLFTRAEDRVFGLGLVFGLVIGVDLGRTQRCNIVITITTITNITTITTTVTIKQMIFLPF